MASYYVNNREQPNGDHEVHVYGCYWLSIAQDTKYLGEFYGCAGAVTEAKRTWSKSNGCAHCCTSCHTS